jgi:DsbC/DsbD-like thiol-disulfide interchange protein
MPFDRTRWTCRILSIGFCLALLAQFGQNASSQTGKGSNGVVKAAATATPIAAGKQTVTVTLAVDKGWHIYANPVNYKEFDSVQTVLTVNAKVKPTAVNIQYPKGKEHVESDASYLVYEEKITIQAVVTRAPGDTSPLEVEVRFNACHGVRKICLPPGSEKFMLP